MTEEQGVALLEQVLGGLAVKEQMDLDLFEAGILDSMAFVELLDALEDHGIEIQPTQVARSCWQTPRSILALIAEYTV